MKPKLAILFLIFIFIYPKLADGDDLSQVRSLFYQGNTHYREEKFEQAITDYESALSLGLESGPLYYNLGNAYFKYSALGKAILSYLRAQRLMPGDADLKSNLEYAQSLIEGRILVVSGKGFMRAYFILCRSFSLDKITWLSMILYFILSSLIIFAIVRKKAKKILTYISMITLALLIICISIFFVQFYRIVIQKEAIVIAEVSDSKFEPLDHATTFFCLNEGESVFVITTKKDWTKVRRIDGKQGWVKKSDIEPL
ncbi:MAG: hypothetical protein ISS44_03890 [Candidatus Omnitrophica bacterium]|nr:hypothetical protein [Candidatus Omnitrophota bacterium]